MRLRQISMLAASGLMAASLLFGCKKPAPEPVCKAKDGKIEFVLRGTKKNVPKGASYITSLKDKRGKTISVSYRLPDSEEEYVTISLEEALKESKKESDGKKELVSCEESKEFSKKLSDHLQKHK